MDEARTNFIDRAVEHGGLTYIPNDLKSGEQVKEATIESELIRLSEAIDDLLQSIDALGNRVQPILRDPEEKDSGIDQTRPLSNGSTVRKMVEMSTDRVGMASRTLAEMRRRVEL